MAYNSADFSTHFTKKRNIVFDNNGPYWQTLNGVGGYSGINQSHVGRQETWSAPNTEFLNARKYMADPDVPRHIRRATRNRDTGHDFMTTSNTYESNDFPVSWDKTTGSFRDVYRGFRFAKYDTRDPIVAHWPTAPIISDSEMLSAGATAIARTLPKNPVANAYVSSSEIYRDGIPAIPFVSVLKDRATHFRDLGDQYLNVEFGWLPFVKDLQDMCKATNNSHSILTQFERDSGRNVRRSYYFPKETYTTITTESGAVRPVLNSRIDPAYGTKVCTVTTVNTTEMWFEAVYTYWLRRADNMLYAMQKHAQEANHLYGIIPTPDNIWKATPWSWAANWVSNFGDVITNINALKEDSQVMRWGYVMCKKSTHVTYTIPTRSYYGRDLYQTLGTVVKRRIKASPYGFDLNMSNFSSTRKAIIAALGISRAPF